ncbi:MAG: hypothetical protein NXI18_16095, partial [Alphaproteobacteria bacterium]|nr:hypothetical protein [Alphaproteobacteria bacterium]
IPATGPGDDHPAKLAVRLRSATPVAQLGAETAYALTFNPDQSAGAGQIVRLFPKRDTVIVQLSDWASDGYRFCKSIKFQDAFLDR